MHLTLQGEGLPAPQDSCHEGLDPEKRITLSCSQGEVAGDRITDSGESPMAEPSQVFAENISDTPIARGVFVEPADAAGPKRSGAGFL